MLDELKFYWNRLTTPLYTQPFVVMCIALFVLCLGAILLGFGFYTDSTITGIIGVVIVIIGIAYKVYGNISWLMKEKAIAKDIAERNAKEKARNARNNTDVLAKEV